MIRKTTGKIILTILSILIVPIAIIEYILWLWFKYDLFYSEIVLDMFERWFNLS